MSDPLMEEIWRVREQLLIEHGGMEGLLKEVKRLERAHRQQLVRLKSRRRKATIAAKPVQTRSKTSQQKASR